MRRWLFVWLAFAARPAGATVLVRWDLDQLVARADRIVIGTVGVQRSVRAGATLMTESTVAVESTLFGEALPTLVLSQLGGISGNSESGVVGDARLVPGQRVVLITYQHQDGRRYLVGMAQGAFVLNATQLGQHIDVPLVDAAGRILPPPGARRFGLDQLTAAIARRR